MKFVLFALVIAIFALSTSALVPLKSVIISFPDSTPDRVVTEAKTVIKAAGGIITHEYKLIKGFAAKVNSKAISAIQTMDQQYNALIEEDIVVHATDSS